MWMWTVGYSVGDAVGLASVTIEQKQANWVSRFLWIVVLMALAAYSGYQIFLSHESYNDPQWQAGVYFQDTLPFPSILICSFSKANIAFHSADLTPYCKYYPDGLNDKNMTTCPHTIFNITSGRFKGQMCLAFNTEGQITALEDNHSFLTVGFTTNVTIVQKKRIPFAVILYSPTNMVHGLQVLSDTPSFLTVVDTAYWAVVWTSEDYYLNGYVSTSYYVSVSSADASPTPTEEPVIFDVEEDEAEDDAENGVDDKNYNYNTDMNNIIHTTTNNNNYNEIMPTRHVMRAPTKPNTTIEITFSYSSFSITTNTEYIEYDWLECLGTLGGASALAMAVHTILMICYEKGGQCCKGLRKRKKDESVIFQSVMHGESIAHGGDSDPLLVGAWK
jgi:hypothetical protein